MGNARWSAETYASTAAVYNTRSRAELFTQSRTKPEFDPMKIVLRESCDSEKNPLSTPIIVGLDVTGSMGMIAENIAKKGLGTLVGEILDRKPVTDPHIMIMAIGDVTCDRAPLQVTQFESDIRIAEQLTGLYLEGGGGGNSFESYDLPWAFAATKTKIDSFDKRGVKGYLFTVGDELPPKTATRETLHERVNLSFEKTLTTQEVLAQAQERYHVFHVIVEQGSYASRALGAVTGAWNELLGRRAVRLNNYEYIAEVILSVIEVNEGKDAEAVVLSWQEPAIREAVRYSLFT